MYKGDLIDSEKACELLGVSRPTFNKLREQYEIESYRIKRFVKFSKNEILSKIYVNFYPIEERFSLNIFEYPEVDELKVDEFTYDLRLVNFPDGHGAVSLLCHLLNEIEKGCYIHLLIDENCSFLKAMNFFGELSRHLNSKIFWNESLLNSLSSTPLSMIKLPIKRLGIVGSQQIIVDDLTLSLHRQGHSIEVCSYIGWALGELADNSATHAKKYPAFIYFEQFGDDSRFLQLTIGDIGIGIPTSLKSNSRYTELDDASALLTAFRPHVSGRPDEEDRGKGLTDVLKIAMESHSRLRVDSNGIGFNFIFNSGLDNFMRVSNPLNRSNGTVISILFIDGSFGKVDRDDVDQYVLNCLGKL